jgi:hypothetical protein
MSLAVIKDSHLKFMGTNCFVANAQTVSIGSLGKKATPVFGQNKLEVKAHIPAPKLDGKIKVAGPFDIDTAQSSKSDFTKAVSASLKVIGFNGSENAVYEELTKKHLKLVQLYVEEEAMEDAANKSPKALDNLQSYGGDARIAHQLFVVMEAEFATSFTSGNKHEISADALGIISITASGGTTVRGKDKITLSPGTGLAYLLLKVDWNKGKTQIEKTSVDEWSVN